ncbi:MAG: hypothetical protein HUJ31_00900, partial [Pseudomonadales bacterium]|nr:hypothetical protein [Pseudomonadales bacterium]
CSDNRTYETSLCTMADVSGTYADQKANVVRIIKAGVLTSLLPGDSLIFVTIDSNSYKEDNFQSRIKLDYIPSRANQQRLAFAQELDAFASDSQRADYTDISGAMMLCADYLRATGSGNQAMLIFSDMKEELQGGLNRNFSEDQLDGIHVAAMNVIKLNADSVDPATYRQRLLDWETRLAGANAASWHVIVDPIAIPEYIEELR